MDESVKISLYLSLLDRVLAGEEVIECVDDEEIKNVLLLAKCMRTNDFSVDSSLKDALRDKLVAHLTATNNHRYDADNDELNEETLDLVAAGYPTSIRKQFCPYCGAPTTSGAGRCNVCDR